MKYQLEEDEEVGTAIIHAISVFKDCSPTSLPPLQETVNVDALNKLVHSKSNSNPQISFLYNNIQVSIQDEHISVSSEEVEQMC